MTYHSINAFHCCCTRSRPIIGSPREGNRAGPRGISQGAGGVAQTAPLSALCLLIALCLTAPGYARSQTSFDTLDRGTVRAAEAVIGLEFSDAKRDSMLIALGEQLANYRAIRNVKLENGVPSAMIFNPIPAGTVFSKKHRKIRLSPPGRVTIPDDQDELAFYSIGQLSRLIRTKKMTSEKLTSIYLARLKKFSPKLSCVVTLCESLALAQARRSDREIALGKYRGPLHGIPYGAKDLLATRGIRTTWGSVPFKERVPDEDATVIRRLEEAGAVLIAKLSMGELAWGDVWFGGQTKNPWNYTRGSSGSSAGSASATAAGLVAFAIGSETWGSIVSPSTECGVTGLRPTYGRVSRKGAMALSTSMDKIGAICRTVEDCAVVLDAICGPDGLDQTLIDIPFNYDPTVDLATLHIGYLKSAFDSVKTNRSNNDEALEELRRLGAKLIPVELPKYPIRDLAFILSAEAAASFDELTRRGDDSLMVRQVKDAWPNVFRASRFIPAVEYIRANRVRYLVIQDMAALMREIDLYVAPSFGGDNLLLTNLTGHPCVVLPNGFSKDGRPTSITFIGRLFDEGTILAVAKKYQDATGYHLKHPRLQ